jgi:hypothetical protein
MWMVALASPAQQPAMSTAIWAVEEIAKRGLEMLGHFDWEFLIIR